MSRQIININDPQSLINTGAGPNDGTGDSLKQAFGKVNDAVDKIDDNFTELYARQENTDQQQLSLDGDTLSIASGNSIDLSGFRNYNALTNLPNLNQYVRYTDLQDSTLTIDVNSTGDLEGSVFGDDSTLLVDGTNSSLNLDGTVKGNIIPDTDIAYDIGSATNRFRDIYLSGNTINLGGSQIQSDNSTIVLPAGSRIGTEPASTFSGSFSDLADVPTSVDGYGITDAVKPGDDISTLTNNEGFVTQTELESGNLSINIGSLEGDLIGSVFADDSTVLVDGVNGSIPYSVLSDVQVTEQDLQVDFAAIVGTQIQTNGLPVDTFTAGDLTVNGSLKTNTVIAESGNLDLNADNYVRIESTNNGQIEIGRNSGVGEVIIGNTANDTDVIIEGNTIFDSGTTVDFTGSTITGTNFLASETVTSLTDNGDNTLTYTDEDGGTTEINLSLYLDDTNLARLTSGTLDGETGVATFTRDDATTFTVDFSPLFDDTNLARITSASFNSGDGVLTLSRNDASDVTVDLDGRYLTSVNGTVTDSLVPDTDVAYDLGSSSNRFRDLYLSGSTIDLAGTQISTDAAGDVEIKDVLNNRKKIIAGEVEIGTGTERVKLARDEITGRIKFDRFDVTTGQVLGATSADLSENTTDDLPQGSTNKYFADSLARNAVSVSGDLSYNSATGVISFTERTDSEVRGLFSATGDLSYNQSTGEFSVSVPTNTSDLTNDSGFIDSSGGTIIGNLRLSHDSPADAELEFENADIDGFGIKAESGNMLIRFYSESDTAEDQIIIRAQDGVDKFSFDIGSGDFTAEGGITSKGVLSIEQGTQESFSTITNATGTVTHDCSNGYIFRHTTPSADWTANFTNLSLTTQHATALTIVVTQGATAYVPTAVQIEGASQSILWQGGSEPSGTVNGTDVVSFSVLNDNGSFVVVGQLASFGG